MGDSERERESGGKEGGRVRNSDRGERGEDDTLMVAATKKDERQYGSPPLPLSLLSFYNPLCVEGERNRVNFLVRLRKRQEPFPSRRRVTKIEDIK